MKNAKKEVYWFHAASYGEYNVIRPVVKRIKANGKCIVVTFFSPSGFETLTRENSNSHEVDYVFYLPFDTPENTHRFLNIVQPKKAIFTISEYWINYLKELKRRNIPTYIVSMLVDNDSYLLKWYAKPIRKAMNAFRVFMVLGESSKQILAKIGFTNVVVTGDPLFDNAITIANEPYHNDIVEKFCASAGKNGVFVAGSISDTKDLSLIAALASANRHVKFIIVPHEISEEGLNKIIYCMEGKTLLYSECSLDTNFSDTQVLVIDFMGALSRIYRYGRWAYVGGGFTPYLHSVIEPMVYGLPVAFGPRIERKSTPKQLIDLGIGRIVKTNGEIKLWFSDVSNESCRNNIKDAASHYVKDCSNVTNKIVQIILE